MPTDARTQIAVCLDLTRAISRAESAEDIYAIALDSLASGLGVRRASILLFDPDGVMRFKAWRELSPAYRAAVEGHTPWRPDTPDPAPIVVSDVTTAQDLAPYLSTFAAEGIAAMAFIPLVSLGRVIGKFMLYYDEPHALSTDDLELAGVIAAQVAFAVERTRAETQARRSEARLRFALDAAAMGTWDWDLGTNEVRWSDNLERLHGLPAGTFDGSFASYEREIHPEDREAVLTSIGRALETGEPHEIEYRIVAPDGTVRWVEGKGQVEMDNGRPVRMTGVCMMVTRRKEEEIARLAAAEEAGRLKDEFLATLSHELRTPLNAVLGWVQMLQASAVPEERLKQALDVIGRNARLQARLIEDILDVSRIITGKLEIERQPIVVAELVEQAVTAAQPAVEAAGVTLESRVARDLPPIEGDPRRLGQVLGNLLSNAIKFTPEGGRIDVHAAAIQGGRVEVRVADTGIGIAPQFLANVFDRFRQADSRTIRQHTGLGLGLAIARHFVELHDGEITVESQGEGQGTTVIVTVPVATATAADIEVHRLAAAMPAADLRLDGTTVLVVDDQADSREFLGALLERAGARVLVCGSAESALDTLATSPVDLLMADIAMPGTDGYTLIRRVRRTHATLPAVAVSAYARPRDRGQALASGYNGYCPKPVDVGELFRTLRDVMP